MDKKCWNYIISSISASRNEGFYFDETMPLCYRLKMKIKASSKITDPFNLSWKYIKSLKNIKKLDGFPPIEQVAFRKDLRTSFNHENAFGEICQI